MSIPPPRSPKHYDKYTYATKRRPEGQTPNGPGPGPYSPGRSREQPLSDYEACVAGLAPLYPDPTEGFCIAEDGKISSRFVSPPRFGAPSVALVQVPVTITTTTKNPNGTAFSTVRTGNAVSTNPGRAQYHAPVMGFGRNPSDLSTVSFAGSPGVASPSVGNDPLAVNVRVSQRGSLTPGRSTPTRTVQDISAEVKKSPAAAAASSSSLRKSSPRPGSSTNAYPVNNSSKVTPVKYNRLITNEVTATGTHTPPQSKLSRQNSTATNASATSGVTPTRGSASNVNRLMTSPLAPSGSTGGQSALHPGQGSLNIQQHQQGGGSAVTAHHTGVGLNSEEWMTWKKFVSMAVNEFKEQELVNLSWEAISDLCKHYGITNPVELARIQLAYKKKCGELLSDRNDLFYSDQTMTGGLNSYSADTTVYIPTPAQHNLGAAENGLIRRPSFSSVLRDNNFEEVPSSPRRGAGEPDYVPPHKSPMRWRSPAKVDTGLVKPAHLRDSTPTRSGSLSGSTFGRSPMSSRPRTPTRTPKRVTSDFHNNVL